MPTPPRDQIESVLADIIKEALASGRPAHVPGLGTFAVRHRNSARVRSDDGALRFEPPRDEITFTPDDSANLS